MLMALIQALLCTAAMVFTVLSDDKRQTAMVLTFAWTSCFAEMMPYELQECCGCEGGSRQEFGDPLSDGSSQS